MGKEARADYGFDGIAAITATGESDLVEIPGPAEGMPGWRADDAKVTLECRAARPLGATGSVSFWFFLPETLHNGPEAGELDFPFLSCGDLFTITLSSDANTVRLEWRWGRGAKSSERGIRVDVPQLPGGRWYHLWYSWDAGEGVFEGALDGEPLRLPGTRLPAWTMGESDEITLHFDGPGLAGLWVGDEFEPHPPDSARIDPAHAEETSALLGGGETAPAQWLGRKGEVLYANPLLDAADVSSWVMEGPGEISFADGWMRLASKAPDGPDGHFVFWAPEDFPEDFIAEWDIRFHSEHGLCIVFFAAKGMGGEDIFDAGLKQRDGVFGRYHTGDIDCYHISYFANHPQQPGRLTSNLRKNHGFFLVANGPPGIEPGSREAHRVSLKKQGGSIRMAVDGVEFLRFDDDGSTYGPVLGEGKIGLRQMQWTDASYRNFRVFEVRTKE